jgi:chaperone modulatory protein CbpM
MVHSPVGLDELSRRCGMSTVDLNELVDYCALVPLTATANEFAFSVDWLGPLQAAGKMRRDFDLDLFTVAILLGNLNRIDCLERQVQTLQARLPSQGAA